MNIKLITALLALTVSAGASAQSASVFEGFYGQFGVGYSSFKPSVSSATLISSQSPTTPVGMDALTNSSKSFSSALSAGYTWSLVPKLTVGIGADYQPLAGHSSSGSLSNSTPPTLQPAPILCGACTPSRKAVAMPSNFATSYQQSNAFAIYIAPGFAPTPESMLYAKLGYAGTQIKSTVSGSGSESYYKGYILGLGYKQMVKGGMYGFAEANYAAYGNEIHGTSGSLAGLATYALNMTSKASTLSALVGAGYKF